MKFLLISIALILFQVRSLSVSLSDTCQCTTIQTQKDCSQMSKCEWDSTNKKCKALSGTDTGTIARFISKSCTDSKDCRKTSGCASVLDKDKKEKCVIMGDCQSYQSETSSNAGCQKYSYRCNWNPKYSTCTSENVCGQYSGEGKKTDCESVTQQNGESWCKFTSDNKCVTKTCSDYTKTTDAECAASLQDQQCKSDKKKCLSTLGQCSDYTEDCSNVITSDKACELNKEKTKCQKKSCKGATDQTSDTSCNTYLEGCISNNMECFLLTLPQCSTYSTTDCSSLKGLKGNCILTQGETPTCRDPDCEDYTETTDKDCQAKDLNCKYTNGVNCVKELASKCDSYQPKDIGNCSNFFSQEGKCKSTDNTKCTLDKCTDQKLKTNEECGKYSAIGSTTCITNGVECVESLQAKCSDITINDNTCEQFISKEGKCQLKTGSPSTCELAICTAQNYTTDEECSKYSSHGQAPEVKCITDGKKCVDILKPCNLYLKEEGCEQRKGSDGLCTDDSTNETKCTVKTCDQITDISEASCSAGQCKFDGQSCVKELKACDTYTSNCDKYISINQKPCATNPADSKCVNKTCSTAQSSISTNEECIKYLPGCVTTGQGCIEKLSTCDSYKGTKTSCEKFIGIDGKCTGEDTNKEQDKCKAKDCANATQSTNDSQCNSFSNTCFYNARQQKCSKKVETCNLLLTQTDCESSLISKNPLYCIWSDSKCVEATCNTINNVKSKEACATFSADCEYDNLSGCKLKNDYSCLILRSASLCIQDSQLKSCLWDTTNNTCFQYNKCSDYQFTPLKEGEKKNDTQIANETTICKLISDKCYSNGGNTCVSKAPCSAITEQNNCTGSLGIDDKVCGYDAKAKACKTFGSCSDVVLITHNECQLYSNTCTSDGTACIAIKNCSDATTKEICQLGGQDGKCVWSDTDKCRLWNCQDGTGSTHDACQLLSSLCTTDGTKCKDIAECSTYDSEKNCVLGLKNVKCNYDKEKKECRNKICTDYTKIENQSECDQVGCAYDPEAKTCIAKDKCTVYKTEKICNTNKQSSDNKECVWFTGTTSGCKELANCSDTQTNKDKCEKLNCYFVPANSSSTPPTDSQCKTMDCYGNNQQSTATTGCKPFKSADGKTLNFCGWNETQKKCVDVDPSGIYKEDMCFKYSEYTYYWSTSSSKCVSCKGGNVTPSNNTTNGTNNTTSNGSDTTADTKGFKLEAVIFIIVSFLLN